MTRKYKYTCWHTVLYICFTKIKTVLLAKDKTKHLILIKVINVSQFIFNKSVRELLDVDLNSPQKLGDITQLD